MFKGCSSPAFHIRLPRASAAVVIKVADISSAFHRNVALGLMSSESGTCNVLPPSSTPKRFSSWICRAGPSANRRERRLTSSGSSAMRFEPGAVSNLRGVGEVLADGGSGGLCDSTRICNLSDSCLESSFARRAPSVLAGAACRKSSWTVPEGSSPLTTLPLEGPSALRCSITSSSPRRGLVKPRGDRDITLILVSASPSQAAPTRGR